MVARRETPAVQGRDVVQRAGRIAEADGGESGLRLVARERELVVGQRRDRAQERPVEQPLVQAPHLLLGLLPRLGQLVGARVEARRASEDPDHLGIARHEVRAREPRELQSVFEQPKEPVVPGELGRLDPADVALRGEGDERRQRGLLPHLEVVLGRARAAAAGS